MLKYLTAGLVAASLLGAPVIATTAEAAQPAAKTTLTTKPVAAKIVKHKRYATVIASTSSMPAFGARTRTTTRTSVTGSG